MVVAFRISPGRARPKQRITIEGTATFEQEQGICGTPSTTEGSVPGRGATFYRGDRPQPKNSQAKELAGFEFSQSRQLSFVATPVGPCRERIVSRDVIEGKLPSGEEFRSVDVRDGPLWVYPIGVTYDLEGRDNPPVDFTEALPRLTVTGIGRRGGTPALPPTTQQPVSIRELPLPTEKACRGDTMENAKIDLSLEEQKQYLNGKSDPPPGFREACGYLPRVKPTKAGPRAVSTERGGDCSTVLARDSSFSHDSRNACLTHDYCYDLNRSGIVDRRTCDDQFFEDMRADCRGRFIVNRLICSWNAGKNRTGVRVGGGSRPAATPSSPPAGTTTTSQKR